MLDGPLFTADQRDLLTRQAIIRVEAAVYAILVGIGAIFTAIVYYVPLTADNTNILIVGGAVTAFGAGSYWEATRIGRRFQKTFEKLQDPPDPADW